MFFLRRSWWVGIKRSEQIQAWVKIASTQEGMIVIHELVRKYHVLTPHDGGERSEGQREVVLQILRDINIIPEELSRLEAVEAESNEEQ